jgi:rSAM/selenodomain-associated transferase 2
MGTTISVIIPTWREAAEVRGAVESARLVGDEIVVADGGSDDGTAEVARAAGARVIIAPKGRGSQLHAGAMASKGDVLLFLHADTRLAPTAREAILGALQSSSVAGGNFFLLFDDQGTLARVFTWLYDVRRRAIGVYYGDSAVFVRRSVYDALGGFRPIPILEDYEFIRRLERSAKTVYLRQVQVRTSTRRFAQAPIRTLLVWTLVQSLYMLGVSPVRLKALYSDARPANESANRPAG